MAFAITGFKTYSLASFEAVTAQFEQVAEFTITRVATDVALSLGDTAGTFWTDAGGSTLGAQALIYWRSILGKAREPLMVGSPQIESTFTRVVSGATGAQYTLAASTPAGISFVLVSGQVLATLKVLVRFSLNSGELPVKPFGI